MLLALTHSYDISRSLAENFSSVLNDELYDSPQLKKVAVRSFVDLCNQFYPYSSIQLKGAYGITTFTIRPKTRWVEVLELVSNFYSDKLHRRAVGDHIFLEDVSEDGSVFLGS